MKKLPNLDALRFFLAFLVVIYHLPSLSKNQGLPYFNDLAIFNRGTEAVYMFFSLSGFLIIRGIYIDKLNKTFSIKKFYMRRILRIFPLYYLIVAFGFLFYWVILPILNIPFENNYELIDGILLTVFFLPNVFAFLHYPGGILEILWSLGIEEQFYLLVAPVLYFFNKRYIVFVLALVGFGFLIIYNLDVFKILKTYKFVYFFLIFGGLTAILEVKGKLQFLKTSVFFPIIIVAITMLYFTTNYLQIDNRFMYYFFLSVLFGLFIHTLSFNNRSIVIKQKNINYFGKISYGIYMYHVIALNLVVFIFLKIHHFFNDIVTIVLINIATFVLTIVMAHLSYKLYETPFLNLKRKFR
ncbi:acyltransferase [Seonamhaeicola sp. NFXS20]|uniref:acyltransferase family protein n=1 Tax=Seonamhaeicola sp. NFXS20 TaxID=2816959 RepID=UPI003B8DFDFC